MSCALLLLEDQSVLWTEADQPLLQDLPYSGILDTGLGSLVLALDPGRTPYCERPHYRRLPHQIIEPVFDYEW